jgi:hypothetical protein
VDHKLFNNSLLTETVFNVDGYEWTPPSGKLERSEEEEVVAYFKEIDLRVISGFCREVSENCALLGYYAARTGNFLPTFRDNISVPFSGFRTSGRNYHYSLRNNTEERSSILRQTNVRSEGLRKITKNPGQNCRHTGQIF